MGTDLDQQPHLVRSRAAPSIKGAILPSGLGVKLTMSATPFAGESPVGQWFGYSPRHWDTIRRGDDDHPATAEALRRYLRDAGEA